MAFLKFANADVVKAGIDLTGWNRVRAQGQVEFGRHTASKAALTGVDPNNYLLSHVTIIASVDTEDGPGSLGRNVVDGFEVDRRFSNYYITPKTSRFVNNNGDSWDRPLLLSCYKTFIGGENYVEHVQIPELSKGKLIDAAARDIGDTVYVDLLVATDRKHGPLVKAIMDGSLQTLSMGCFTPGTLVTMADGSRLPIEEVSPGNKVLTHKGRSREVLNKQVRGGHWKMRRVHVVGVPDPVEATNNHPFFVLHENGCVEEVRADSLSVGALLFSPTSNVSSAAEQGETTLEDKIIFPITKIEEFDYDGFVYDMEVDEDHSYLVHGLAVHNCQVAYTQCSKCGNVAEDETQLCSHIRYAKRNEFFDELGNKRIIAELCGHKSDPESVKFFEASWVANPAFEGAVVRSFLSPEEVRAAEKKLTAAFSMPARQVDNGLLQKAARQIKAQDEFPGMGETKPEADPLSKAVNSLVDVLRERAIEKVRGEIGKDDASKVIPDENRNTTLIKDALRHASWRGMARVILGTVKSPKVARKLLLGMILYKQGGWKAVQASKALTGKEILGLARLFDLSTKKASRAGDSRLYRVVVEVGGISKYADEKTYLAACRRTVGRDLTDSERVTLLDRGYLYSLGS